MLEVVRVAGAVRVPCIGRLNRIECWNQAGERECKTSDHSNGSYPYPLHDVPFGIGGYAILSALESQSSSFHAISPIERLTFTPFCQCAERLFEQLAPSYTLLQVTEGANRLTA
jgi:hypothetical protein